MHACPSLSSLAFGADGGRQQLEFSLTNILSLALCQTPINQSHVSISLALRLCVGVLHTIASLTE
jgi:hypothetical protein